MKKKLFFKLVTDQNNRRSINKIIFSFFAFFIAFSNGFSRPLEAADKILQCPQPRSTKQAPSQFYNLKNPVELTPENIKKGKLLYFSRAKPMPCKTCHGANGDGNGPIAKSVNPPPRDFTCKVTMKDISDGQLFWIIKYGSKGTNMLPYKALPDKKIWQIILYLRTLTK